jgi:hypothetical protein
MTSFFPERGKRIDEKKREREIQYQKKPKETKQN